MTKNTQSHVGETSVFTLPSPARKQQQPQEQEQGQEQEQSPSNNITAPLHKENTESNEEFQSPESNRSPSLPWLVEYFSSSLCRAPEMVLDNLCSCKSAVDPNFDTIYTNASIVSEKSSKKYFDDTILRSDPKVDRSPTKISPNRWEALRQVVASHGDYSVQDYCDFYDVQAMPSIEETKEDMTCSDANSIYPTKQTKAKARSLMDDSKDEDDEMEIDEDDDIREGPHSDQDLHTCQSFDHYFVEPSRRFLCAAPSTPPPMSMNPPLSPPTTRLPDRRRNRQTHPITPRALGFQILPNSRLTPPSPAPSAADTYTTISLSQSFAREFDEDEDDLFQPVEGSLFLDRLASETLTPSRSPFRRLRPRTTSEEKKEEAPLTPKRSNDGDNKEDNEQYRCLVRMSPDNYKHGKTWHDEFPKPEETGSVSSTSSSVLLPLHPHQRIMEPLSDLPSGYSLFRDHPTSPQLNKRRIAVPQA